MMKRKNFLLACLTGSAVVAAAAEPAARFEILSVPQVSQAVTRMGNCIAPRFRDTVAAATLILSIGPVRCGMDPARPLEILFYSFGEKPVMRIVAHAVAGKGDPDFQPALAGRSFQAKRKGDQLVLDTDGVSEPFPEAPPGKNLKPGELIRGTVRADAVRRHFKFRKFNTRDTSAQLILRGVDELLDQLVQVQAVFAADGEKLKLELTAVPEKGSSLEHWMQLPLPPKGEIETFPGAQTLTVLRLNPTGPLRRYGLLYLEQSGKKPLSPVFAAAASGFAVLASDYRFRQWWSMRLTAGLVPDRAPSVENEVRTRYKETPFRGWYSISSDPVLRCSSAADRLVFFCSARMDTGNISALIEPREYTGAVPDCPFVCLDLTQPETPLAQLRVEKGALRLILQAKDQWFSAHGPLLEKPLFLPEKRPAGR